MLMRDFQRKRKIRKILYSRGAIVAVLALLIFAAKATWSVHTKESESRRRLDSAAADLVALQTREKKLHDNIDRLKTPEGMEAQIREQFQVAKPGERMVVLVDEKKDDKANALKEQSLISKFFDLFR